MDFIIVIVGLLFSIILHELAHGYVADRLGDFTPRYSGRLTLNPLPHLDPIGSFLLPITTFILGGFIFGWAKPVPINPLNLNNPRRDLIFVALAGPLVNIFLALFLAFSFKVLAILGFNPNYLIFFGLIRLNFVLAFFNLLPIPPLDGSRLFLSFLPFEYQIFLEQWGIIFIFLLVFFGFSWLATLVNFLTNLVL